MQALLKWYVFTPLIVAAVLLASTLRMNGSSSMAINKPIYKSPDGAEIIHSRYKEILEHYPVDYTTHNVETRQGRTFVIEAGTPGLPKLVLLHGSMSNSLMWMNEVSKWKKSFHIYSIDIIGEPGLSAPSRPALDSTDYANWIDDVRNDLGIGRMSLVGTSLGGWFALDYTIRRPDSIDKLVLISPGGIGKQRNILWWVIPLSLMGDWGKNKVRELMIGKPAEHRSSLANRLATFLALIPKHFNPRLEELPIFTDAQLAGISAPVMAVVGGKDMMLDAQTMRSRLQSNVYDLTLDYLPEARHFPGDRSEQIFDFLSATTVGDNRP